MDRVSVFGSVLTDVPPLRQGVVHVVKTGNTCALLFILGLNSVTVITVSQIYIQLTGNIESVELCHCHCLSGVSNLAWWRIFREIPCFSPFNIGTLFRCVLGQSTLSSHASLDSGVNQYLVGQRWQCVRLVPSAEMAVSVVCSKKGVEMTHE